MLLGRNRNRATGFQVIAMKNPPTLWFSILGLAIGTLAPAQDNPPGSEAPPPAQREEGRRPNTDRPHVESRPEAGRPSEGRRPEPRGERPLAPPSEGRRPEMGRPEGGPSPHADRERHERMLRELRELSERVERLQRELGQRPAGAQAPDRERERREQQERRNRHVQEAVEHLKAAGLERAARMVEMMARFQDHPGHGRPGHSRFGPDRGHRPGPGGPPPMNRPRPEGDKKS